MNRRLIGREARPASPRWNLAKTLFQMSVFWLLFLGVFPSLIYAVESASSLAAWRFPSPATQLIGIILFVLASCLGVSSAHVMAMIGLGTPLPLDCARHLVIAGPYRYVRNPMAVAGLSQGVAVGLILGSPAIVLYALAGGPVWNYIVRPTEERDLADRFGESFRAYQRGVRCWLPRLRPYAADANLAQSECKQA